MRHLMPASSSIWRSPDGVSSTSVSGGCDAARWKSREPWLARYTIYDVFSVSIAGADLVQRLAQVG